MSSLFCRNSCIAEDFGHFKNALISLFKICFDETENSVQNIRYEYKMKPMKIWSTLF